MSPTNLVKKCGDVFTLCRQGSAHLHINILNVPCLSRILNTILFKLTLPIVRGAGPSVGKFLTNYPQESNVIIKPTSKHRSMCVAIKISDVQFVNNSLFYNSFYWLDSFFWVTSQLLAAIVFLLFITEGTCTRRTHVNHVYCRCLYGFTCVPDDRNVNFSTDALKSWLNNTFLWILYLKFQATEGPTTQSKLK